MHDHLLGALSLLISAAIAVWVGLHVARSIHRAGVEHYSGRVLILAAITNTTIMALILLLLGAATLRGALTPAGFHAVDLALAVLLLILPVRSVWNYIKTPARMMGRLDLIPAQIEDRRVEVAAAARVMGVAEPSLLSSPQCRTPFVFGRNSRRTHLVLPDSWDTIDVNSRSIMLCHELAHIRNRDAGFLTWSWAFLNDLEWALLLSPIVIALSFLGEQGHLPRAAGLYVTCLLVLWIMTNTVVRSRELLADVTVAMLIDSGKIARTFNEILLAPETGFQFSGTRFSGMISHMMSSIRRKLADKALFSKHVTFWRVLSRSIELLAATHPSASIRRKAIHRGATIRVDSSFDTGHAFGAGVTLGFLAVLIALGGFWTAKYILVWHDSKQIVLLSHRCWGLVTPLAATFVALFFVLPAWSSLRPHVPTRRNMARFLVCYLYGLLGACCILPLILLGGSSHTEIRLLLALSIRWVFIVLAMGIVTNIVMLSLWLPLRYRRRALVIDLAWMLYSCGLGLLAILCYLAYGLFLMSSGRTFAGGSVIFGLFVGVVIFFAISKESRFSGMDQYTMIISPSSLIALEGSTYRRWAPVVGSMHMIVLCLGPAAVISVVVYTVANQILVPFPVS